MTKTTTIINVTAEHIARGKRESCSECPVALAIAEVVREDIWIIVRRWVHLSWGYHQSIGHQSIGLPVDVVAWICDFDTRLNSPPMPPISFSINIRSDFLRASSKEPVR